MTSPLMAYANAHVGFMNNDEVTVVNGRISRGTSGWTVYRAFLVRDKEGGSQNGGAAKSGDDILPGVDATGDVYQGYLLGSAMTNEWPDVMPTEYQDVLMVPQGIWSGSMGRVRIGELQVAGCYVTSIGGKFGGGGIDAIVRQELQGVPIRLVANILIGA